MKFKINPLGFFILSVLTASPQLMAFTSISGYYTVSANETLSNVAIEKGNIHVYGKTTDAILYSGAMSVYGSAVIADTKIYGGFINLYGRANNTHIDEGGFLHLSSGGTAQGVTVLGGKVETAPGSLVMNAKIEEGTLLLGGIASAIDIFSGGEMTMNTPPTGENGQIAKGFASIVKVYSGGKVTMSDGSLADVQLYDGLLNMTGGEASRVQIHDGGIQTVSGSGVTKNTTINSGGQSWLYTGALADGETKVVNSGKLMMEAGSRATNVVMYGGNLSVMNLTDNTVSNASVQIDKLTMVSGAAVSFQHNNDSHFSALNISHLSGSGSFLFNSSLAERSANFVTIEQGTGNFGITVTDSGREIADHDDLTVNLVHDQGGDIHFSMVTANGRSTDGIDGGTYMYTLYSQQDKDGLNGNVWYLGAMPEENNNGGDNGNGGDNNNGGSDGDNNNSGGNNGGGKLMTTPATDAILAMSGATLNVINAELNGLRAYRATLDKTGPASNVWGHYIGSNSRIDTSNGAAYRLEQNGMEIGADIRTDFARGSLVTGALMSYSDNHVKHARGGKSNIDSYGLGIYSTWFDNSGFYVDGVLKGNRLDSKLSAKMTNGDRTSGDWHQYAISTALESGYMFDITNDVKLTPYGRFTLAQVNSKEVTLSNGMKGNTGTLRSVTGETGAKVSGKLSFGSTEVKPYLSAAVVQEFADSNEVTINEHNRFDNNQNGTSGKYGLGSSVNIGKNTTLYGEINYRQGSHIEEPVQGVLGLKFAF